MKKKMLVIETLAAMMFFLPTILMLLCAQSSFASGVTLVSLLIIFSVIFSDVYQEIINKNIFRLFLILFSFVIFILLHFILTSYFIQLHQDYFKFVGSYFALVICLVAAITSAIVIIDLTDKQFDRIIYLLFYIIILNTMISFTKIDFFKTWLPKPTFLFSEPSHLSIVAAPFILYFSYINKHNFKRLLILGFFLVWTLYIRNLTMLLVLVFSYLVTSRNIIRNILIFILISLLLFIFIPQHYLNYYLSRLDIFNNSQNLSVLVFLQGWQNAILTISHHAFGVGFQQFGISTDHGGISYEIYEMFDRNINAFDGGSNAPKIVGEFGFFGIVFILIYLYNWFTKTFNFITSNKTSLTISKNKKSIFFNCVFISSFFEMFVRGTGYFSPTMFLLAVSISYFYLVNKKIGNNNASNY